MQYFTGLDLSLKKTFITIINDNGDIVKQGLVATDIKEIDKFLEKNRFKNQKIGIEAGQLSISISKGLLDKKYDVICVDARQMASLLSARKVNKNDLNDSVGIAQMIRANLYKEVKVKSDQSCKLKVLLGSRKQIVNNRMQISGTIRGLLKIYGIKISAKHSNHKLFTSNVTEEITKLDDISKDSITALLASLSAIKDSLDELDKMLIKIAKEDKKCSLLTTVPGVGIITAVTYKVTLDDPRRFRKSATVGAYIGLTPKQYASGEINRQGSISKMGPTDCRYCLYEAAQCLLLISKKKSKLKSWGLKLAKKKGRKKAIVAVARKLAVIMHRMLIDEKEFCYN